MLEQEARFAGFHSEVSESQELHLASLTRDIERLSNQLERRSKQNRLLRVCRSSPVRERRPQRGRKAAQPQRQGALAKGFCALALGQGRRNLRAPGVTWWASAQV